MPDDIKHLFPIVDGKPEYTSETFSMCLEKINGITFSHLITNRALTNARLTKYLAALQSIHLSNGQCAVPIKLAEYFVDKFSKANSENVNIYANYFEKLEARFVANYDNIYYQLGDDVNDFKQTLCEKLKVYEQKKLGKPVICIHGDPVLSNGILTPAGEIRFLDMRGRLGDAFTTNGDSNYDLAKVYQSLLGYDFIICSKKTIEAHLELKDVIPGRDIDLLAELRVVFWKFVNHHYGIEEDRKSVV